MEISSSAASHELQVDDESNFNLKEWGLRARRMSREGTVNSRRFSASNLKSFREEARSFRSNVTVSSTASSPGYTAAREEIDPSTYSFTTALRALQAKAVYTWELQGRNGLSLNSKWNEAEKYISNPLSGEVPLECLSAKTLSGRSVSRITMSAPLIYPSHQMHNYFHANPPINEHEHEHEHESNIEKKRGGATRDVGTQSTPVDVSSSSSPSLAPTPSIQEASINIPQDSSVSLKSDTEEEVKETRERERNGGERKKQQQMMRSRGGCLWLSLRGLWMRTQRHRDKHRPTNMLSTFLHQLNGCTSKQ